MINNSQNKNFFIKRQREKREKKGDHDFSEIYFLNKFFFIKKQREKREKRGDHSFLENYFLGKNI